MDHRSHWSMCMRWHDLLFAHWPVPVEVLRPFVPDGLDIDTFDGSAWLGVIPFRMSGIRLRLMPPLPGTAAFPELNVRTYVRRARRDRDTDDDGGVWFFSLDAASRIAVRAARRWFGLPYFDARFQLRQHAPVSGRQDDTGSPGTGEGWIDYTCRRKHTNAPPAAFEAMYRPIGAPFRARVRTIERFLTERYRLYALRDGQIVSAEIHHVPWPLQPAEIQIRVNTMAEPLGVQLSGDPVHLHFARRLDVLAWRPAPVPV